jgi:hypothetical protein
MFVADGPPSDEEAHRWQNAVDQNQRASLQAAGLQFHLQNDLVAEFSDGVRQFDCRTPPKGIGTPTEGFDGTPASTVHLRTVERDASETVSDCTPLIVVAYLPPASVGGRNKTRPSDRARGS